MRARENRGFLESTMKPTSRSEIIRIFANRHKEAHPFKRDSAGMEWFSRTIPLVHQLSKKEIDAFIVPLIDNLLRRMDCCALCRAKLLVFGEIFCSHKSVRSSISYWKQYQQLLSRRRKGHKERDFRTEVYHAIETYLEQGKQG